jgi:hypothetical protein
MLRIALKAVGGLVVAYFFVGLFLSAIFTISFFLPSWAPSSQRTVYNEMTVVGGMLRVFVWGPFFVSWINDPEGVSFGQWLAPGLYPTPKPPFDRPPWERKR